MFRLIAMGATIVIIGLMLVMALGGNDKINQMIANNDTVKANTQTALQGAGVAPAASAQETQQRLLDNARKQADDIARHQAAQKAEMERLLQEQR